LISLLAKETAFNFDEDCLIAFYTLKKALISAPVIQPPDWNPPFEIMCNASDYAIGAVLGHCRDIQHYAISYASKTLTGPQLNYAATEKEILAVVFSIEKFRSYLVGDSIHGSCCTEVPLNQEGCKATTHPLDSAFSRG
jgi:hypothetical protein